MVCFTGKSVRIRKFCLLQIKHLGHPIHFLDEPVDPFSPQHFFFIFFFVGALVRSFVAKRGLQDGPWTLCEHNPGAKVFSEAEGSIVSTGEHQPTQQVVNRYHLVFNQECWGPMNHRMASNGEVCGLRVHMKLIAELEADQSSHHFSKTCHFSYFECGFGKQHLIAMTVNYAEGFAWREGLTLRRNKFIVNERHLIKPTRSINALAFVERLFLKDLLC